MNDDQEKNPWLVAAETHKDELEAAGRHALSPQADSEEPAIASSTTADPDRSTGVAGDAAPLGARVEVRDQTASGESIAIETTPTAGESNPPELAEAASPPPAAPVVDDQVVVSERVTVAERPARSGRFHSTRAAAAAPNPFLPAPSNSPTGEGDEEGEYAAVKVTGPAAPTGAPAPAVPLLRVPARFDQTRAYPGLVVQVVGLHGGAGATTIAALLGREAIDCGPGLGYLVSAELPVVLVARTHAHGLQLVKRAAAQWASGGLEAIRLLGVVLVDDAPQLSKGLHREVKSLERALPYSWRLAWSEELRHSAAPPPEAASGRLRRIRKSLLSQATKLPRATAREITFTEGTA